MSLPIQHKTLFQIIILLILNTFIPKIVIGASSSKPDVERTYALIIAIDQYQSTQWSPFQHNVEDAKNIQKLLSEKYDFDEIILLDNEKATKTNIEKSLKELSEKAGIYDNLLIYFSGHTYLEKDTISYWVPVNAVSKTSKELIKHTIIQKQFQHTKARHILLLSQGTIKNELFKTKNYIYNNYHDVGSRNYYSRVKNLVSRQAITFGTTKPIFNSAEDPSIFSKYFLKFLNSNRKEYLAVNELFELLKYPLAANSSEIPAFGYFHETNHEGGQFVFHLNEESACEFEVTIEEGKQVRFNRYGTLHARTTQPKGMQYEWKIGEKLVGKSRLLDVNRSEKYTVIATTLNGCSRKTSVDVLVERVPLRVKIKEASFVEFTNTGVLHASCNQSSDIRYEWRKDNRIVGGKPYLRVYESGLYTVQAYADSGRVAGSKVTGVRIKKEPKIYKVQVGDDLQHIAQKQYGNADKWLLIYDANKSKLGRSEILLAGQELVIPEDMEIEFADEKALNLVTGDGLPPFVDREYYKNGVVTDVVLNVFEKMGQKVSLNYMTWQYARNTTENQSFDVTFPYIKTSANTEQFYLSDPIDKMLLVWFVRADSKIETATLKDAKSLEELTVAQVSGYELDALKPYAKKGLKIVTVDSVTEGFELLYEGKIKMVVTGQLTGVSIINENSYMEENDFRILNTELGVHTIHLMVSKRNPGGEALIFKFNKTLEQLRNEGKLNDIQTLHRDIYQRAMEE